MTPDTISALTSVISLVDKLSAWPFGLLLFLFIVGPWVLALMLAYTHRKRFETVVGMYENNVELVKNYETVAGDLKDVIILSTQTMTTLVNDVRTNQYCPEVRLKKEATGRQE